MILEKLHIEKDEKIHVYKHKCGLELIYVQTKDEDSTFCATFKTLPKNDRGIPHILEHMVLCGSNKYPIDDPFNELVKGSLFTYLNAITYKDKTIYPISSKNKSEFEKLYKVYLDAVFAPILSKEAFLKEGVRKTKTGYSGIVFNEMSSVYNDPQSIIDNLCYKYLFEGTPYAYDSGGNPTCIKDATHEEILQFYNENYKKEKTLLYFYGDLDIEKIIDYIETTYLQDTQEQAEKESVINYNLQNLGYRKEELILDKKLDICYHQLAFAFDRTLGDNKFYLEELSILIDFLLVSDTSILTEFLKEKYDLIDVSYDFDVDLFNPVLSIVLKSSEPIFDNNICVYDDVISFLKNVVKEGFDKEEFTALLYTENFKYIEENFGYKAKGLVYFLDMYSHLQYDDQREYFHIPKKIDFTRLKEAVYENYFENLLEKSIILNKNVLECFVSENENFEVTKKPNDEEEYTYESILPFSDKYIKPIDPCKISFSSPIEFDVKKENQIFYTNCENDEIAFITIFFLYEGLLDDVGIFLELFGETHTKNYTKKEIKILFDKYIGDLELSFESIFVNKEGSSEKQLENYIVLELKVLTKYIKEAFSVLEEITNNSVFDDETFIKNKIEEMMLDYEEEILTDNVRIGLTLAYKGFNERYYYKDLVEGKSFYERLGYYKKNKTYNFEHLKDLLKSSTEVKTYVSIRNYDDIDVTLNNFLNKIELNAENSNLYKDFSEVYNENKAIKINSDTFTNILVGQIKGYEYSGICEVFASIIKNEYLSEEIRILGGAYGYDFFIDYDMYYHMVAIDDPNFERTKNVFKNMVNFVKNSSFSEKDIQKNIIGTVNDLENFKNFYDKYYYYVLLHVKNVNNEYLLTTRKEILSANLTKIKQFSSQIDENKHLSTLLTLGNV